MWDNKNFLRNFICITIGLNRCENSFKKESWIFQIFGSKLNFSYFLLLHNLWWHGWALTSLDWHLSLQMTEPGGINWHRIDLYLCRRGLKFIVSCNQEQRLSLMLIFVKFWWLRAKIQGGSVTPKGIVGNQTHFVFESYLVGPSIWPSFIQIGEIACVTPACTHGRSLKVWQKSAFFLFWATVIGNLGKRFNS